MSKPKEAPQTQLPSLIKKASWDGITVEYSLLDAVGEFDFAMPKQAISIAFAPHDKVTWSVDGGSSQTTGLPAGSAFVYGDRQFIWHKRERCSEYINIMLSPQFLEQVASENGISAPVVLLEVTKFPVAEIAHRVGFYNPSHFTSQFRKFMGMTPKMFRDSNW